MLESDPVVRLQTNFQILRNFGKICAQATDLQAPILAEIARAAELLLQLRLYELLGARGKPSTVVYRAG